MKFKKLSCSTSELAEIISFYPYGPLVDSIDVSGIPNTTFLVRTTSLRFVLRIYGKGQSSLAHINFEHRVLAHLKKKAFASPELLRSSTGQSLWTWRQFHISAFSLINGVTADSLPLTPDLAESVGELVGAFRKSISDFPKRLLPSEETLLKRGRAAMQSMTGALAVKGWNFDGAKVQAQWKAAAKILQLPTQMEQSGVLHADTWAPNIICDRGRAVGIVDFDDCCYGPNVVDLAIPLQEFAIFQPSNIRYECARSLFSGFRPYSDFIPKLESAALLAAMEFMCSVWFAYNAIQSPRKADAQLYYNRLQMLRNVKFRASSITLIEQTLKGKSLVKIRDPQE